MTAPAIQRPDWVVVVYASTPATVLEGTRPGTGGRGTTIIDAGSELRTERLELIPLHLKALVVSLALACIARDATAQGQTSPPVPPGSRVRVMAPPLVAPLVANFLEQRGDTLVFIEDGRGRGVWSFAINQIQRLERTAGDAGRNKKPIAKGALIGAGVGLAVGLLFADVAEPSDSTEKYDKVLTGLVGAGVGAGVGAFVGSRFKSERWIEVPLPGRLSLRLNRRHGVSIGIAVR